MNIRRKSSKRKLRPFRSHDEINMGSSLSFTEWMIMILVVCELIFIMYAIVTT